MKLATKIELSTISLWIIIIISSFVVFPSDSYKLAFRDNTRIIQGILFLVIAIVSFVMLVLLYQKYRTRKTTVSRILLSYFLFSFLGAILQGTFSIVEFSDRKIQSVLTDSAFIFIGSTSLVMCLFIIEVFTQGMAKNPSLRKQWWGFILATIIGDMAIIVNIFFDISDITLYLGFVAIILITFWAYGALFIKSFKLQNRLDDELEKKAFKFISFSGLILFVAFCSIVLYNIMGYYEIRYLTAITYSIGFVFLFYGFTLPMNKRT